MAVEGVETPCEAEETTLLEEFDPPHAVSIVSPRARPKIESLLKEFAKSDPRTLFCNSLNIIETPCFVTYIAMEVPRFELKCLVKLECVRFDPAGVVDQSLDRCS